MLKTSKIRYNINNNINFSSNLNKHSSNLVNKDLLNNFNNHHNNNKIPLANSNNNNNNNLNNNKVMCLVFNSSLKWRIISFNSNISSNNHLSNLSKVVMFRVFSRDSLNNNKGLIINRDSLNNNKALVINNIQINNKIISNLINSLVSLQPN